MRPRQEEAAAGRGAIIVVPPLPPAWAQRRGGLRGFEFGAARPPSEVGMLNALKRYEIQLLLSVGHSQAEVAKFAGVGERSVRRVAREGPVMPAAAMVEEISRSVGRPSVVEPYRALVEQIVQAEPALLSVEILRRAKLAGYRGGKSALYELVASLRPPESAVEMRFEGEAAMISRTPASFISR